VRRGWAEYRGEAFGRLAAQVEEICDLRDSVLVLGRFTVSGRRSQIDLDTELGELVTFRARKLAAVHDYLSHGEALEATGLRKS
jgi:hypothetical protein